MERHGRYLASSRRHSGHLLEKRAWRNLEIVVSSSKKMRRLSSSQELITRHCIANKHGSSYILINNIRHPTTVHQIRSKSNAEAESHDNLISDSRVSEELVPRAAVKVDLVTSATYQVESEDICEVLTHDMLTPDSTSKGDGTLQGAIALVIGTSVGAGILALPARTAHVGFVPTTITMVVCWLFLVLEALILAEVNVALLDFHIHSSCKNRKSRVVSLCAMAEETLGPLGGLLSSFIYCFLSYTVMVAYIAKSGDVLSPIMHISPSCGRWIFTIAFGGLVFFGGTGLTDVVNQIMTFSLLGVFCVIIMGGWTIANWSELQHMDWSSAPDTLPVILFSLVYHDLMPVLCTYLKGDLFLIRLAILLGSAIPLVMFAIWNAVILCIVPLSGDEDPLNFLIKSGRTGSVIMIDLFSVFALATSLIGTLLGFKEFFREKFGKTSKDQTRQGIPSITDISRRFASHSCNDAERTGPSQLVNTFSYILHSWWVVNRTQVLFLFLILAPPLAVSAVVSNAFFSATDLAGAYGMTALYGLLPPAMAWSRYEKGRHQIKGKLAGFSFFAMSEPQAKTLFAGTAICALGIILSQFALDLGK